MALTLVALTGCPSADIRRADGGPDASAPDAALVDAGSRDAAPPDAAPPDAAPPDTGTPDASARDAGVIEANVVFVTSTAIPPSDLGGITGADTFCNEAAARGGLPDVGSYVAWLSTTSVPALSRLRGSQGWVRPDGAPFVNTPDDLMGGKIFASPSIDELGGEAYRLVATGTNPGGSWRSGDCGEWTSAAGMTGMGASADGTRGWTSRTTWECSRAAPIYCFGTGRVVPVLPTAPAGRLVFLSRDRLAGDAGRDAFDAACQADAVDAGFTGRRLVAFVSTSTEAAVERLTEGEPWVRPDGVLVARSKLDFTSQLLRAPITPTADRLGYRDVLAWGGSTGPGVRAGAGEDCGGWLDAASTGRRVEAGQARSFFEGSVASCSATQVVICIEP